VNRKEVTDLQGRWAIRAMFEKRMIDVKTGEVKVATETAELPVE
jgi:hypothetical protein